MAGYKVYLGANGSDTNEIIKAKPSIAVIEMTEFTDSQIKKLRTTGIKLIAYLNVGAIEKTRPYYQKYKKYAIGNYSDWDEKWMDLSKEAWQNFLIEKAKAFKKRGAMGLYIDNLDVVEEYKSKKLYAPARAILKHIRKETGLYLMVNGGGLLCDEMYQGQGGPFPSHPARGSLHTDHQHRQEQVRVSDCRREKTVESLLCQRKKARHQCIPFGVSSQCSKQGSDRRLL